MAITVVTAMVDMHAMIDAVTTLDIKLILYSATPTRVLVAEHETMLLRMHACINLVVFPSACMHVPSASCNSAS